MNALTNQVVSAYESNPGGIETLGIIAREYGLEVPIVQAILQTNCPMFKVTQGMLGEGIGERDENGELLEHPAPDISKEVFEQIKTALINSALDNDSKNAGARVRAQIYLFDEYKGRNDKVELNLVNNNVTVINNHFARLRDAQREARERKKAGKVIDVASMQSPAPAPANKVSNTAQLEFAI